MDMYNNELRRLQRDTLICVKDGKKKRGRPEVTWMEVVKKHMKNLGSRNKISDGPK